MLFSQVLSIFLRVLCEVVTHRKTIIGSAKAPQRGERCPETRVNNPLSPSGAKGCPNKSYIDV